MELNCICGHCVEIHYDGPLWAGRFICLTDKCECRNLVVKES